jgi:hypothetical protein
MRVNIMHNRHIRRRNPILHGYSIRTVIAHECIKRVLPSGVEPSAAFFIIALESDVHVMLCLQSPS